MSAATFDNLFAFTEPMGHPGGINFPLSKTPQQAAEFGNPRRKQGVGAMKVSRKPVNIGFDLPPPKPSEILYTTNPPKPISGETLGKGIVKALNDSAEIQHQNALIQNADQQTNIFSILTNPDAFRNVSHIPEIFEQPPPARRRGGGNGENGGGVTPHPPPPRPPHTPHPRTPAQPTSQLPTPPTFRLPGQTARHRAALAAAAETPQRSTATSGNILPTNPQSFQAPPLEYPRISVPMEDVQMTRNQGNASTQTSRPSNRQSGTQTSRTRSTNASTQSHNPWRQSVGSQVEEETPPPYTGRRGQSVSIQTNPPQYDQTTGTQTPHIWPIAEASSSRSRRPSKTKNNVVNNDILSEATVTLPTSNQEVNRQLTDNRHREGGTASQVMAHAPNVNEFSGESIFPPRPQHTVERDISGHPRGYSRKKEKGKQKEGHSPPAPDEAAPVIGKRKRPQEDEQVAGVRMIKKANDGAIIGPGGKVFKPKKKTKPKGKSTPIRAPAAAEQATTGRRNRRPSMLNTPPPSSPAIVLDEEEDNGGPSNMTGTRKRQKPPRYGIDYNVEDIPSQRGKRGPTARKRITQTSANIPPEEELEAIRERRRLRAAAKKTQKKAEKKKKKRD